MKTIKEKSISEMNKERGISYTGFNILDNNDVMFIRHIDYQIALLNIAKETGFYSGDWFVYQELMKRYTLDDISEKEVDDYVMSSGLV